MISAIILAAGQSKRIGQPKMLLPWGRVTVIERVVSVFASAGIEDILVITGGDNERVFEIVLRCSKYYPVRSTHNQEYQNREMLSSIQCGLRYLSGESIEAAMIGLGDQPQVHAENVRTVYNAFLRTKNELVVPSFRMRRGHPWLVARSLWDEILEMGPEQTARDFLNRHAKKIHYVDVESPSILADLDTLEDYYKSRP